MPVRVNVAVSVRIPYCRAVASRDAGPDVVSPQVLREQCAHRAVLGPDVHIGGIHGMLGDSRMMIDNMEKRDTRKGGVVMRLRIDHRKM